VAVKNKTKSVTSLKQKSVTSLACQARVQTEPVLLIFERIVFLQPFCFRAAFTSMSWLVIGLLSVQQSLKFDSDIKQRQIRYFRSQISFQDKEKGKSILAIIQDENLTTAAADHFRYKFLVQGVLRNTSDGSHKRN